MYWCRIYLALKEGVEAQIDVGFRCVSSGYNGDYWTEPEGPEFQVMEVVVDVVYNNIWVKGQNELGGWYDIIHRAAEEAINEYDELYEHQYDAYTAYLEN